MPYPDFLYIGAPRAGSTWLGAMLQVHPGIWVPPCKAIAYYHPRFQRYRLKKYIRYWQGRFPVPDHATRQWFRRFFYTSLPGERWYQSLFPETGLSGEIAEAYSSLDEHRVARIARVMPDVKIIITLRNPVERAISHAVHGTVKRKGRAIADVSESELIAHIDHPSNEARTRYCEMLDRWQAHFPDNQLLINFYEQLCAEPEAYLRGICNFLGADFQIDSFGKSLSQRINAGGLDYVPSSVWQYARKKYESEIRTLAWRLDGPVLQWRDRLDDHCLKRR